MALWMIRTASATDEAAALEQGLAILGFTEVPNLAAARNYKEFQLQCQRALAGAGAAESARAASQLWAFRSRLKPEDVVLMPRHQAGGVAIGKVGGAYEFRDGLPGGARHARPVEWVRRAIPRSVLDDDLLLALSSAASIAPIRKRNGEERIRALAGIQAPAELAPAAAETEDLDEDYGINLEENARDRLRLRIREAFPGASLAELVDGLLTAQGYRTQAMPPGDDAVLLMAARGPMGLDRPRLCVQVCFAPVPQSADTVKDFQAAVKNHGAEQGLLVSWPGFQAAASAEAAKRYFALRLWDDEDLIDATADAYDRLPPTIRSALRLRRIWIPD